MTGSVDREIAEAVAAAGDTTTSRLGLRFDRVVVRVLNHLRLFVGADAPEGLTVLLTLTAPVRAPKTTAVALEREVAALLQNGCPEAERSVVLYGNRAALRLIEHAPRRGQVLLGFVHNPDVDAAVILHLAERWLRCTDQAA